MLWEVTITEPYCSTKVFETEARTEAEAINNARFRFCQRYLFGEMKSMASLVKRGVKFQVRILGGEAKHPV